MVELTLSWPDKRLSPNARVHWGEKYGVIKKAREEAIYAARAAGVRCMPVAPNHVSLAFYPPDKRKRDLDNMLAGFKAHLDGIADACGVDDSTWKISLRKHPCDGQGRVVVTLEAVE